MNHSEKRLNELIEKREKYRYIITVLSDIDFSLSNKNHFIEENKTQIQELKKITDEIADLRWGMMNPKQQKDYLDKYAED
ncbi:MAG TPA: hypothetical protein PKN96_10500 [Flavobacterium sp.]|uniref:hypothetical protein n=1 Tax=Flavobacterium sp. TaxID=239 RepID=UPI002C08D557|nr:hypothetical protein [Flavobacterium sp.]HNP33710.1 hypothetical protein [Flavobacterium sp.]